MTRDNTTVLVTTAFFGIASVLLVLVFGRDELLSGVAAGALVGFFNLYLWVLVVRKLVGESSPSPLGLTLRILMKYGFTGGLIVLFLVVAGVNLIGFAIGLSNLLLGPIVGGLIVARR